MPTGFLSAAKDGEARIRVTAALQCPTPVELLRWQGNPFLGTRQAEICDVANSFGFRRVHPDSIHYTSVCNGALQADEMDETDRMQTWLAATMRRTRQAQVPSGAIRLSLAGTWPMLRVGDRVVNTTNIHTDIRQRSEAVTDSRSTVRSITSRWTSGAYRRLRRTPPVTELELAF